MNQLSTFYCFIILYHINTQPPDHLQVHTHAHTRGTVSTHTHRHVDTETTTTLISHCLDDRCLFITRHPSILFGDWLNVFLARLPLNYLRNEDKNKRQENIYTYARCLFLIVKILMCLNPGFQNKVQFPVWLLTLWIACILVMGAVHCLGAEL